MAVPARLVAQPVVVHVRLRDGTRHLRSCECIDDARLGVDAQVGQIPRSERGRVQPGALGGEDQPQLAGGGPDGRSRGGVDAGEQVLRGEAAGSQDAGFEVVGQLLEAADGGCGGGAVELCGGLGGDDDDGWGEGAGCQGQVDAGAGDGVEDDGGVGEEGGEGEGEAVGVGEGVGGEEGVGGGEAVGGGQGGDEGADGGGEVLLGLARAWSVVQETYLLGEFDDLGWLADSFLPEEDHAWSLAGIGRQHVFGVLGVLHKLVPDGDVDLATNALWDFVPVHVPAGLLHSPHDLAQSGHASSHISEGDGSSLRDQCIGTGGLEQLDKGGVRLVVGDEDGGEAVESAGEQDG